MMTTKISFPMAVALALGLGACSDKSKAEADKEADEAYAEHREAVAEANENPDAAERDEELAEANEELAEDYADAYEGTPEADGGDEVAVGKSTQSRTDGQRFVLSKRESTEEFVARARKTIADIEADLARAKAKKAPADDVSAVDDRLDEAKKDLDEVAHGTTDVIDDGKVGVTVAINSARRKLDRIEQDLADSK